MKALLLSLLISFGMNVKSQTMEYAIFETLFCGGYKDYPPPCDTTCIQYKIVKVEYASAPYPDDTSYYQECKLTIGICGDKTGKAIFTDELTVKFSLGLGKGIPNYIGQKIYEFVNNKYNK